MRFTMRFTSTLSPYTLFVLFVAILYPCSMYAEMVLHTEKNGFKWYLNIKQPYSYIEYDAYSFDKKCLIKGDVNDEIHYFCIAEDDPGRFIYSQYQKGGNYLNKLYDSEGNFIAILDAKQCIDDDNIRCGEIKRIKFGSSYYFLIRDYRRGTGELYGVIDDSGRTTVAFGKDEISDKLYSLDGVLEGCLIIGNNYENCGFIRPNGEDIIPKKYGNKAYGEGDCILFYSNNGKSLLTRSGELLIKDAKNITKRDTVFDITLQDNTKGIFSLKDKHWIASPNWGFDYLEEFKGPNKAKFYQVREVSSKQYGIVDLEGNEIMPCEFEYIEYIGGNFFKFKSGPNWGVVTTKGKVIIPTSRGYSSIGKYSSIQKRIPFTKPGYTGECNSLGTQVSLIKAPSTGSRTGTSSNPSNKTQVTQKNSVSGNIIPSENNDKFWYSRYGDAKFDSTGDKIISTNYVYPTKDSSFEIQFEYKTNKTVTIYLNEIKGNNSISRISTIGTYKISDSKFVVLKTNSVNFFSLTHHVVVDNSGAIIIYNISRGKYVSAKIFQPNGTTESIYKIRYDVLCSKLR